MSDNMREMTVSEVVDNQPLSRFQISTILMCAFVAVLVADPWAALAVVGLVYLIMLPFSRRSFRRLKADAEALQEEIPDELEAEPMKPISP